MLFQEGTLFPDFTIMENVAVFSRPETNIRNTLRALGLGARYWNRSADNTLSGGERQRTLIAQAIASSADAIFFDEPLKGLDKIRRTEMFRFLGEMDQSIRSRTVVVVEHDFELLFKYFDFVYEIIGGRWVEIMRG